MTLDQRFRTALLATALISLTGFGLAEHSVGLLACALVASAAGWWVTEVQGPRKGWGGMPRWLSSLILLGMLVVAGARAMGGADGEVVSAFSGFLASIIVIKLWEKRELRDYGQILTMSLFMTVAATLQNNSLLVGVMLLVQLPVLVTTVMLFQMYAAKERAGTATLGASVPWRPLRAAVVRVSAACILAGLLISTGVFIIIPRGIGLGEWGDVTRPGPVKTIGFRDEVEPGTGSLISASQATVMDVAFTMQDGRPLGGGDEPFYLRGAVLDRYDALRRTWTRSKDQVERAPDVRTNQIINVGQRVPGTPVVQHISMREPASSDTPLFALFRPISIMFTRLEKDHDVVDAVLFDKQTGWVGTVRRGAEKADYEVLSILDPPTPLVTQRREGVSFPSDKIKALAAQVLRAARYDPDPATRPIEDDAPCARAFEVYLRHNYTYALDVPPAPGNVMPTEWFLFDTKRGHCEYFASALAALCRSVGIDARVIAGYLCTEFDPATKFYTVRASDAHAWVEVNTGPGGWQHRDATPVQDLKDLQDARSSLLARLGRLADSIQNIWNTTIVAFDQSAQDKLLGQPAVGRNFLERVVDTVREKTWWVRNVASSQRRAAGLAMEIGAAMLVTGMVWVGLRAWRRRRARRVDVDGWAFSGPERRVHSQLLKLLASRGFAKPAWRPTLAHLSIVAATNPGLADATREVISLIYRARFGGGGSTEIAAAGALLKDLRRRSLRTPHTPRSL